MTFEEAKRKHCACIYKIAFPDGKYYVGKTMDLGSRIQLYFRFYDSSRSGELSNAICRYGFDSLDISVLTEVSCKDKSDLDTALSILEIKYIRDLNTITPNGYNVSVGGEILGIRAENIYTGLDVSKNYGENKPILLYGVDGKFLKEYPSVLRCAYDLGLDDDDVRAHVNKKRALCGKYLLREKKYNYVPKTICVSDVKVKERVRYKNIIVPKYVEKEINVGRPCKSLLYDENGDFCGEFDSKIQALRSFTNSHSVPYGAYFGGYIVYKKVSDDYPKKIEPYSEAADYILGDVYRPLSECDRISDSVKKKSRKNYYKKKGSSEHDSLINDFMVRQYNDSGFEKVFQNIRDASKYTHIPYANIWACVFGRTKTCRGYHWEKYDK